MIKGQFSIFKAEDVNPFYFLRAKVLKCLHVAVNRCLLVNKCFLRRQNHKFPLDIRLLGFMSKDK